MYRPEIERIVEELYFVAASPAMRRLRTQAESLAQADVPVLITGEAGSGRTTIAWLIHCLSLRSSFPFTIVDCGVLTSDLLESELFGSEQPTVSGQPELTLGKFEQCARGTVLLGNFSAMTIAVQQRLLNLLQTREFVRVGGCTRIPVDFRIIAAKDGNLETAAAENTVNQDLYHRLSVFQLHVPPLRERREEIPLLLGLIMNRLTRHYGVPAPQFSSTLLDACQQYSWPGNLTEMENFVKRFLAVGDEQAALEELHLHSNLLVANRNVNGNGVESARARVPATEEKSSLKVLARNAKEEAERNAIAHALEKTRWNRKAAAQLLNISYRGLLYKIQEYRMAPPFGFNDRPGSQPMAIRGSL